MHPRYLDKGIGSTNRRGSRHAFIEFSIARKFRKFGKNPKITGLLAR